MSEPYLWQLLIIPAECGNNVSNLKSTVYDNTTQGDRRLINNSVEIQLMTIQYKIIFNLKSCSTFNSISIIRIWHKSCLNGATVTYFQPLR